MNLPLGIIKILNVEKKAAVFGKNIMTKNCIISNFIMFQIRIRDIDVAELNSIIDIVKTLHLGNDYVLFYENFKSHLEKDRTLEIDRTSRINCIFLQ